MPRERLLTLVGYDPELLSQLSGQQRHSLRGVAVAWSFSCALLGVAAAYAAWLIQPVAWASALGGTGIFALTLNLIRVMHAGGGNQLGASIEADVLACKRYRPTLIPAMVFVVLAAILAQPSQLVLWPELEQKVELHRTQLIAEHEVAALHLGTDPRYYRDELMSAGFPIFRLKLVWNSPKRAVRYSLMLCFLVLLPTFWSQWISIASLRAYELARCRRTQERVAELNRVASAEIAELLQAWPSYAPAKAWPAGHMKRRNKRVSLSRSAT